MLARRGLFAVLRTRASLSPTSASSAYPAACRLCPSVLPPAPPGGDRNRRLLTASASRRNHDDDNEAVQQEMQERRRWVASFQDLSLRRNDFQVTFSRSSGPGGQNVNKLNTKANVRLDLSQAGSHSPDSVDPSHPRKWLTRDLVGCVAKRSPYYVASDHSILMSSMRHRTQEANVQDALDKLHAHLLELAQEGLVGETSQQQRDRVKRLQEADARRKKQNKIKRADVKSGRKLKG